jgi:hypothetical protein
VDKTLVRERYPDGPIELQVWQTPSDRLIGYILRYKDDPRTLFQKWYMSLHYNDGPQGKRDMKIVYQDQQTRLLSFGESDKDFFWAVRWRPQE